MIRPQFVTSAPRKRHSVGRVQWQQIGPVDDESHTEIDFKWRHVYNGRLRYKQPDGFNSVTV